MNRVLVVGIFDNFKSHHVRLLHEASKLGKVHVVLWPDAMIDAYTGTEVFFSESERFYLVNSQRYVLKAKIPEEVFVPGTLPESILREWKPDIWVTDEANHSPEQELFARERGITYRLLSENDLAGFPQGAQRTDIDELPDKRGKAERGRKRCVVTGCYDWFHSGHIRFFEEASRYGDLYVIIGHDANVRLLKGEGHPLFPQAERLYMVQAVQYVAKAFISTGEGWLDAEPEIDLVQPDFYVVNEDGDKPEKRDFCKRKGIEYVVLKRAPKKGLDKRTSTNLRGF